MTAAIAVQGAGTGWREAGLAFLAGAVATLALPPLHVVPALAVAFPALLLLIGRAGSGRGAFAIGWCFGFGHFTTGLYWFAHALLTEPEKFAWLIPFAVSVIPAILAIYIGLVGLILKRLGWRGWAGVLGLAGLWSACEVLRALLFSGFPWNLLATVWTFSDAMIQPVAWIGPYGVGAATVMIATAPVLALEGRGWKPAVVVMLVLLVSWFLAGAARLPPVSADAETAPRLRIVQPNIAQHHKWREDLRRQHLERLVELSLAPGHERIAHVVWPEAAIPYFLNETLGLAAFLGRVAPPQGTLIAGLVRLERGPRPQLWNGLSAIDRAGREIATYDKTHLVPFGEYLPLRPILGLLGLDKLAWGMVDFSAGPGPRSLRIDGLPAFSPLICYEAIFPDAVLDPQDRPRLLLNLTNDAWFGISSGPYQHFAAARLRAVEQGLPLIRAANTGISAVIDSFGRSTRSLGLGESGVVDATLPKALDGLTIYARWQFMFNYLIPLSLLILGLIRSRRPAN
ncbi:MAG: apolipoprotein N-acyltransferase [Alphaproteobacteria bacterium]|nr:apolipoprotein N-acyltransferase [Alphaproteobacteria bacterium]